MNYKIITRFIASAIVLSLGLATVARAQEATPVAGNYASVNGLDMYYEVHGEGDPLILIHGGLGGIVEFAVLLPALAETHQVIAVEMQGHGHTADTDRPLSYESMADDVAALIENLGFESADMMGYSMGGGVALQTAIRHPEVVRKLVLVSTTFKRSGIHDEFLAGMSAMSAESASQMLETPTYQFYSSVAPNLDNWSTLVGKIGTMMSQDYDWSEDVAKVTAPTLILAGDSDMLAPAHAAEMFGLLGGGVAGGFAAPSTSQLAIIPKTMHFDILYRADVLLPIITPFLNTPIPTAE